MTKNQLFLTAALPYRMVGLDIISFYLNFLRFLIKYLKYEKIILFSIPSKLPFHPIY